MREQKNRPPFRKYSIARDRPADCTECEHRPTCKKLCPDVERWVDQDTVGIGILLENSETGVSDLSQVSDESVLDLERGNPHESLAIIRRMNLTERNLEFVKMFYMEGKRKCDIAKELNVSDQIVDFRHKSVISFVRGRLSRLAAYENLKHFGFESGETSDIVRMYFFEFIPITKIASSIGYGVKRVYTIVSSLWMLNKYLDTHHKVGGDGEPA